MSHTPEEEHFGILTDDDLYLDCILIRPAGISDDDLKSLRVWVPHFPLTKTSTIICARHEVQNLSTRSKTAHLVFDLRGTGLSDGAGGNIDFKMDLQAIRLWAEERFGEEIKLTFLGLPISRYGRVNLLPLRSGVVMESTYYPPSEVTANPPLIYLSTFGTFDRVDDVRCGALAHLGYEVYGLDPFRYLLHASAGRPVTPADLLADLRIMLDIIGASPILIGQPLGAGLALFWTTLIPEIKGVIAIGQMQAAFKAAHIFGRQAGKRFDLEKAAARITPRPITFVWQEGHPLTGTKKELAALYKNAGEPKKVARTSEISPQFLKKEVDWIIQKLS